MPVIKRKIETLKAGSQYIATVRLRNTDLSINSEYTDSIRFIVPSDTTIPGKLQNLKIYANFMTVMFVFDPSNEKDALEYEYELYNYDEVFLEGSTLAIAEGKEPSFTGVSRSNVFTVSLNEDFSTDRPNSYTDEDGDFVDIFWFGRVRTIDTAGNIGPWSDIAQSDNTPLIEDQFVKNLTASKITAGTIGAHTITLAGTNSIIQSSNYVAGSEGWQIKGDGSAEFDSTVIRGGLRAGSVFIDENNRWNADEEGNVLGSNYFKVGSATKYMEWNPTDSTLNIAGNLVGATGTFSGNITGGSISIGSSFSVTNTGALTASGVNLSGRITASDGFVGGWVIGASSISSGGTVLSSDGTITCNILQTRSPSLGGSIRMGANFENGEELEFYHATHTQAVQKKATIRNNLPGSEISNLRLSMGSIIDINTGEIALLGTVRATGSFSSASLSTGNVTSSGNIAASGTIRAANGSLAAPGISFTNSTNTGLARTGTDEQLNVVRDGVNEIGMSNNGVFVRAISTATTATWRIGTFGRMEQATSTIKVKDKIKDLDGDLALSVINNIRPVEFVYTRLDNDDDEVAALRPYEKHIGFIAEWMADLDTPWSLAEYKADIHEDMSPSEIEVAGKDLGSYIPSYWKEPHMIALLTAAVKKLSKKVDELSQINN